MAILIQRSPWIAAAVLIMALATPGWAAKNGLPKGPNDTWVAIYLPASDLGAHFYVGSVGAWAYPGK